jgi:hypothetical protein
MKILNMTKNEYIICDENGSKLLEIKPCGKVFEIAYDNTQVATVSIEDENKNELPIYRTLFHTELPPIEKDIFYVVDLPIKLLYSSRNDLLIPIQPYKNEETGETYFRFLSV